MAALAAAGGSSAKVTDCLGLLEGDLLLSTGFIMGLGLAAGFLSISSSSTIGAALLISSAIRSTSGSISGPGFGMRATGSTWRGCGCDCIPRVENSGREQLEHLGS